MSTKKRGLYWYMIVYVSSTENGETHGKTMDVLGDNWCEAAAIAESVMDPNDQLMSIGLMGEDKDYDLYEQYLERRNQIKIRQDSLRSSVTGENTYIGEISPTSIPFEDDDTIELT